MYSNCETQMTDRSYKAFLVSEVNEKKFNAEITGLKVSELPEGDVLIRVEYSSINYKDALSASGNKAVTRMYPHTPGIDAAGKVVESSSENFDEGDEVVVTGYDLGMNTAGGFGQFVRVPAAWIVPLPDALSLKDAMVLGTAGITAALCVEKLIVNGLSPSQGEVLVTGASGGVGIIAVSLLEKLGFDVIASTGKEEAKAFLKEMGATNILDRNELIDSNQKPLLRERWAGAVDVVGGDTLFNVIKSLKYGGSVASCGLVQSPMFNASVLPFILRGVNLLGVDSVELPLEIKTRVWKLLSTDWKLKNLNRIAHEIGLDQLQASLNQVLQGQSQGRFVLNLNY